MARTGKGGDENIEVRRPVKRGAKGRRNDGLQLRKPRRKGWTAKARAEFIEVLRATCNVQEGLRAVGLGHSGAYYQRKHDPQFSAQWKEAIEQGYTELEMHLLRLSLFGAKTTEVIDDGTEDGPKRTKTVHSYNLVVALRLLLAHKDKVHAYRSEQGIERPGSDAIRAEIQEKLALVRARTAGRAGERAGEDKGEDRGEGESAAGGRDGNA